MWEIYVFNVFLSKNHKNTLKFSLLVSVSLAACVKFLLGGIGRLAEATPICDHPSWCLLTVRPLLPCHFRLSPVIDGHAIAGSFSRLLLVPILKFAVPDPAAVIFTTVQPAPLLCRSSSPRRHGRRCCHCHRQPCDVVVCHLVLFVQSTPGATPLWPKPSP